MTSEALPQGTITSQSPMYKGLIAGSKTLSLGQDSGETLKMRLNTKILSERQVKMRLHVALRL